MNQTCDVGECHRSAHVAITFHEGGQEHFYCRWHDMRSDGVRAGWKPWQIHAVRMIDEETSDPGGASRPQPVEWD